MLRDTAGQDDVTADDANGHDLRDTPSQWDAFADGAAGHDLRELAKRAGLEDVATNVPRRRSQRFKKKTKKVKSF